MKALVVNKIILRFPHINIVWTYVTTYPRQVKVNAF